MKELLYSKSQSRKGIQGITSSPQERPDGTVFPLQIDAVRSRVRHLHQSFNSQTEGAEPEPSHIQRQSSSKGTRWLGNFLGVSTKGL